MNTYLPTGAIKLDESVVDGICDLVEREYDIDPVEFRQKLTQNFSIASYKHSKGVDKGSTGEILYNFNLNVEVKGLDKWIKEIGGPVNVG